MVLIKYEYVDVFFHSLLSASNLLKYIFMEDLYLFRLKKSYSMRHIMKNRLLILILPDISIDLWRKK